jgi:hypothetical protein
MRDEIAEWLIIEQLQGILRGTAQTNGRRAVPRPRFQQC